MSSLATLPAEILYIISRHLKLSDLNSLVQTNRRFFVLLLWPLYKLGTTDSDINALHHAASCGCPIGARLLIESGAQADINARGPLGSTPLHLACQKGQEGMVKLLLEKKCDVMAKDDVGRVALHYAAVQDEVDIVRLLLDVGIDKYVPDRFHKTAADLARYHRAENVVQSGLLGAAHERSPIHEVCMLGFGVLAREDIFD